MHPQAKQKQQQCLLIGPCQKIRVLAGPTFLCGFGITHLDNASDLFMEDVEETGTDLDLLRIASRLVQRLMDFLKIMA